MKNFFGFGSSTPPPPAPPSRPPAPPAAKPSSAKPAPVGKESPASVPSIVGRWQELAGSDTTEFGADGTVVEKTASGETIRGRYSIESAKLKIKLEGVPDELSFFATIANDALEMKDRDGQVTHYRRV